MCVLIEYMIGNQEVSSSEQKLLYLPSSTTFLGTYPFLRFVPPSLIYNCMVVIRDSV